MVGPFITVAGPLAVSTRSPDLSFQNVWMSMCSMGIFLIFPDSKIKYRIIEKWIVGPLFEANGHDVRPLREFGGWRIHGPSMIQSIP